MTRRLEFRETEKQRGTRARKPKIRCPKCAWSPRKKDRWSCSCGHTWNTFDTRGKCPACETQWRKTQCLECHKWSAHEAWYDDGQG